MNVVWSDEAAYALVALETKLAERYPAEKAAQIIDELVVVERVAARIGAGEQVVGARQVAEQIPSTQKVATVRDARGRTAPRLDPIQVVDRRLLGRDGRAFVCCCRTRRDLRRQTRHEACFVEHDAIIRVVIGLPEEDPLGSIQLRDAEITNSFHHWSTLRTYRRRQLATRFSC